MIAALRITVPGVGTTVQDLGRYGFQRSGVPVAGPMDRIAFRLANALAGNDANAAALEMLMLGPTFEVLAESLRFAIVGGVAEITISSGDGEKRVATGRSVLVRKGEIVKVGPLGPSLCGYLAVEGGVQVPLSLGSASTYTRSGLGGVEGRPLRTGDVLHAAQAEPASRTERALAETLAPRFDDPIRVVLGPQDDYFTKQAIERFLSEDYKVTALSDRMGFRLEGAKLDHIESYNIVSDGVLTGSIQVPGDAQPIILMVDSQTAGGYPKIATVISSDIPLVARRKPGASIRFAAVTQDDAETIRREQENDVKRVISRFREVTDEPVVNLEALASANLIGGVVSGAD